MPSEPGGEPGGPGPGRARGAAPATRRRMFLLGLTTVGLTVFFCLLAAEIVLRFFPVHTMFGPLPVTPQDPVFHYAPNRTFIYSHGWNFDIVNHGRINNYGWVNDQDYRKDDPTPLLAVVGDSFVQASAVPYRETMQGRLAQALAGKMRVYSFGTDGAPLSQYLIFAQYAVREFGAREVIINVVGNDFDDLRDDETV
jgi:hypothetical protein